MLLEGLTFHRRLAVLSLQVFTLAGLLAYGLSTLLRSSHEQSALLDGWLNDMVAGGAAALCLARGVLVRRERSAWLCVGSGLAVWTSGNVVWWLWVRTYAPDAFPSVSDALWLGIYPFLYVAGAAGAAAGPAVPPQCLAGWCGRRPRRRRDQRRPGV